ncbi:MAG: IclR family transcriptional regulator [Verrucomicrobia bacterium]|nr:IclR family transcriptional regulator [Verrucomicrobiota bacterium]
MTAPSPDYSVPALEKGLEILEALSASPEPLTLSSLAGVLNRKNSEIFRMLNFLERRCYVIRDDLGGYRLSLKLYQISHAQCRVRQLVDAALPALQELSAQTGESCHLSVLEGAEIVVLAGVESPRPVHLAVKSGGRFSAIHTVSGRMLLAGLSAEARLAALQSAPEFQRMKRPARMALEKSIARAARERFSSAANETVAGVVDAAVEIGNAEGGIHAALAISSLHAKGKSPDPKVFLSPLRKSAQRIEARIGFRV